MFKTHANRVCLAGLAVFVLAGGLNFGAIFPEEAALGGGTAKSPQIKTPHGQRFTAAEEQHLLDVINDYLKIDPKKSPIHLLRARRAHDDRDEKKAENHVVVMTVDYRNNKGTRYVIDIPTNKVVSQEAVPGHPQSSKAERDKAEALIMADTTLGPLLKEGVHLAGGFVIDPPKAVLNKNPNDRYIEYNICSADNKYFLRVVFVDLSNNTIASAVEPKK